VLGAVGEAEHAAALHEAVDDEDESVRAAAARALSTLERRLDRPLPPATHRAGHDTPGSDRGGL
jgi:hypothetical protein